LKIETLMKLPVYTVKPHDSVAHARAILEEHRINQLPVVVNRRLVGIVTDRDLRDAPQAVETAVAAAEHQQRQAPAPSPDKISVEAVMTTNVLTLTPADTLEDAARLMRRERIGAVPIVDRDTLVGIVTRSDILGAFVALGEQQKKERTAR
jgi:acetoin utilization protein AcuB